MKWEYLEGGHAIEQVIALVKVQMNQLAELIVYQHQITGQLINQVSQGQTTVVSPKSIPITKGTKSASMIKKGGWTESQRNLESVGNSRLAKNSPRLISQKNKFYTC